MSNRFLLPSIAFLSILIVWAPPLAVAQQVPDVTLQTGADLPEQTGQLCSTDTTMVEGQRLIIEGTVTNVSNTVSINDLDIAYTADPTDPPALEQLEETVSIETGTFDTSDVSNSVTYEISSLDPNESVDYSHEYRAEEEALSVEQGLATVEATFRNPDLTFGSTSCDVEVHLLGSILGTKYEDLDADGERESGEPNLSGWEITVEGTAVTGHDIGPISDTTDSNGVTFSGWPPGSYTVSETLQSGWRNSQPGDGSFDLQLSSNQDAELLFGNWQPGSIFGQKWQDDDEDGERDDGEPGLQDWTIELDNGATTTTDADGNYSFTGLDPGTYTVSEVLKPGWTQTAPPGSTHTVTLQSGQAAEAQDFGNAPPTGSIHGQKFFDRNGNGQRDLDSTGDGNEDSLEVGLNGFVIELIDGNGNLVETQTTHSADLDFDGEIDPWSEKGLFWFEDLPPGNYTVRERGPEDPWTQTFPEEGHSVTLEGEERIEGLLFGNRVPQDSLDFGDLPEPKTWGPLAGACNPPGPGLRQCYPTLLPAGARHVVTGPHLGTLRPDGDGAGQPDTVALGDDTDAAGDDEDGFQSLTFSDSTGSITYRVNTAAEESAWLSAWIDFNNDGILGGFFGPRERVCFQRVLAPGGRNVTCTFPVPTAIRGGYTRARITTDSVTARSPTGLAPDGEVEDRLGLPGTDGGDAPDSTLGLDPQSPFPFGYPIRLEDDGAVHAFGGNTRLGDTQTDPDLGLPSMLADGDDADVRDDEDGLLLEDGAWIFPEASASGEPGCFVTPLERQSPGDPDEGRVVLMGLGTNVAFQPLATKTGFLSGWVDWNRDGDWQDDGEQVFDGAPIDSGPNFTSLLFQVPPGADPGWTFARFRYSTVEDQMAPTGVITTGEVEDCLVGIVERSSPDFGDAPEPYPTLSADSGASHVAPASDSLHLGQFRDSETDGLPSPAAQGDDTDIDSDDEDGVTVLDSLHPGTTAQMEVVVTAGGGRTGFLNGWFDWNRDGDWQDDGEHIVANEELGDGTYTLSVSVPDEARVGPTVARFRFSETEGLAPRWTGSLSDAPDPPVGEVEDHQVDVTPEDVSESGSAVIDGNGREDFDPTGLAVDFCDVEGAGMVSVYKGGDRPESVQNVPEANVSAFSFTVESLGPLAFGNCTELRFAVSALEGIENDPTKVTVYRREETDEGDFSSLPTSVDSNGTPSDISDDSLLVEVGSFSEFALGSDTEPLPVELDRLEATIRNDEVLLTWRTASETNNAGFYVQRQEPETGGWADLGFVEGAGTTGEPRTYEFTDEDLPFAADTLTYRLRQVDTDGTSSVSRKVTVQRVAPESARLLEPYPNPAQNQATVRYALPQPQEITIRLYDMLGRAVRTVVGSEQKGRHMRRIDLSGLPSGTYFLRLNASGETHIQKLTVVR